jgi:hypothetical protein
MNFAHPDVAGATRQAAPPRWPCGDERSRVLLGPPWSLQGGSQIPNAPASVRMVAEAERLATMNSSALLWRQAAARPVISGSRRHSEGVRFFCAAEERIAALEQLKAVGRPPLSVLPSKDLQDL